MASKLIEKLIGLFIPSSAAEMISITAPTPRDWSFEFPNVPKPEDKPSIHLIAAAWQCHDLYGEDMPRVAADLLEAGYDTPSFRRLAGELQIRNSADAQELVAKTFAELGVPYPLTEEQAQLIYTRQIAREVIAGRRASREAANYLERILWGRRPANEDLATLFALNDEWEWDSDAQRYAPAITSDILDVFARLGRLTDDEVFACKAGEQ